MSHDPTLLQVITELLQVKANHGMRTVTSDVRISGTIKARERRVIDRRARGTVHGEHVRHLAIV
jgi:RNase P/RNase MRP subunit POP5